MAATLTADQELVYASFPIDKEMTQEDGDGNIIVYGKATDGTVDSDRQIVDVSWSAQALRQWLDTGGNVRVQHNPMRDPAGKGLMIDVTPDGHYVKALVVEPVAKDLVRHQILQAFSVGISRPKIDPDPTGKALGGIIRGGPDTQIVEVSLVDRPANKNCGFQMVAKSAGGQLDWTGKVWGGDILNKMTDPTPDTAHADMQDMPSYEFPVEPGTEPTDVSETPLDKAVRYRSVSLDLPDDINVAFSPSDLAKLNTFAQELGAELAQFQKIADAEENFLGKKHRKFPARSRRQLAGSGHALPDGSYPIPDADALRRAAILARSGHGNVSAARRLIARRAKELGVPNPLSESDAVKKEDELAPEDAAKSAVASCDTCKQPMASCKCTGMKSEDEPEAAKGIAQMNAGDNDTDSDADEDDKGADKSESEADSEKASKPKKSGKEKKMPPWLSEGKDDAEGAEDSNKAGKPTPADGVTGMDAKPVPEHREPDGAAIESFEGDAGLPTVPDSSVKFSSEGDMEEGAAQRFKSVGIAYALGVLHDMTCPAFAPEDVAKAHPDSSFSNIDLMYFAQKAMDMSASGTMTEAARATKLWTHAQTLKSLRLADIMSLQAEAHKAFRDANPGVSSFPTPGHITAERYRRGPITAGHAALSPGQESPHTALAPSGQIDAGQFGRGFVQDGHAADSPANKGIGVPTSVDYVPTIRENGEQAMRAMHDHVTQTFPDVCCLGPESMGALSKPVPAPQGTPAPHAAKAEQAVASESAVEDITKGVEVPDAVKAAKKLRKKLGKKVLSGKMTVDEARAQIGRRVAQKAGGQTMVVAPSGGGMGGMKSEGPVEPIAPVPMTESVAKSADTHPAWQYPVTWNMPVPVQNSLTPDIMKSALDSAVAPLLEKMAAMQETISKQQGVIDTLADLPDPHTQPFRGMAVKSARPAGMQSVAEIAERTRDTNLRRLHDEWRTSPDSSQREAAWAAMQRLIRET
jgi:hypothetical protein